MVKNVTREQLEKWYDDEMEQIELDFKEGRITEKQYYFYIADLDAAYKDDLADFQDSEDCRAWSGKIGR